MENEILCEECNAPLDYDEKGSCCESCNERMDQENKEANKDRLFDEECTLGYL